MNFRLIRYVMVTVVTLPMLAAQQTGKLGSNAPAPSGPEIGRLAQAFAGAWDTAETMEHSQFFPNGGARRGAAHFELRTSGTTLVEEGGSDGSAGKLTFLIVFWWDPAAQLYHLVTCFNGTKKPCELRGTARWEGDTFVNDYEEPVNGKPTKFQDVFSHITPRSFTLVEQMAADNSKMKPLITTKYARRSAAR